MEKENEILNKNENAIQEKKEEVSLEEYDFQYLEEIDMMLEEELKFSEEELEELKKQREKIDNPESIGSVIKDEIFNQIAIQTGLDLTNDTLIGNQNKREVGHEFYEESDYKNTIEKNVRGDKKFKDHRKKENQTKTENGVVDEYTGEILSGDNKTGDRLNVDHIVSAKEEAGNRWRQMAGINTEDVVNREDNFANTNAFTNQTKSDKSAKEYIKHNNEQIKKREEKIEKIKNSSKLTDEQKAKKIAEHQENINKRKQLNEKKLLESDKKARNSINRDIAKGVAKNVSKKAVGDELKKLGAEAIVNLIKGIVNSLIKFFRNKEMKFKNLIEVVKLEISKYFETMKNKLKESPGNIVKNVVTELLTGFSQKIQKAIKKIKQTVGIVWEGVKYITNKENWKKDIDVMILELSKIVFTGITTILATFSGEWIASQLENIPFFKKRIEFLDQTIGGLVGNSIGAIFAGILGAIGIHYIQAALINKLKEKEDAKIIAKQNEILKTGDKQIFIKEKKLEHTEQSVYNNMTARRKEAKESMEEDMKVIKENLKLDTSIEDSLADLNRQLADI